MGYLLPLDHAPFSRHTIKLGLGTHGPLQQVIKAYRALRSASTNYRGSGLMLIVFIILTAGIALLAARIIMALVATSGLAG